MYQDYLDLGEDFFVTLDCEKWCCVCVWCVSFGVQALNWCPIPYKTYIALNQYIPVQAVCTKSTYQYILGSTKFPQNFAKRLFCDLWLWEMIQSAGRVSCGVQELD